MNVKGDNLPVGRFKPKIKPFKPTYFDLLESRKKFPIHVSDLRWKSFLPGFTEVVLKNWPINSRSINYIRNFILSKLLIITCFFMFSVVSANAMSFSELKEKIRNWHPGDYISCDMVRAAYNNMSEKKINNLVKRYGATEEDIKNKKAECGVK